MKRSKAAAGKAGKGRRQLTAENAGAWLPWEAAERLCRLKLGPASRWQVLLAVVLTSARFGGRDAWLRVGDVTGMTGLSARTVKAACDAYVAHLRGTKGDKAADDAKKRFDNYVLNDAKLGATELLKLTPSHHRHPVA